MITISNIRRNDLKDNKSYILCDLVGLSTDSKPTKIEENIIKNGSTLIEIDTQDIYIYDEENEQWLTPTDEEPQEEPNESE